MIVISNTKFSDEFRDSLRITTEENDILVIEYIIPSKDEKGNTVFQTKAVKRLAVDQLFEKYTGYQFNLINNTILGYKLADLYATRDGLANNSNPTIDTTVFYIHFGRTKKDLIILSVKPIDYTNVHIATSPTSIGELAANYYPELLNNVKAFKYKRQILTEIDPHTSLAYLETQLDLMCLVINTIIEKDSELKAYLESKLPLTDIMSAVMDHNVSNVKEVAKCIEDVIATKSKIRGLQKLYIDTKNGVTNAN